MFTIRIQRGLVVAAVTTAALVAACGDKAPLGPVVTVPPTIAVTFSGGVLTAEIAATPTQRDTGLMNRPSLGADRGMLFAYPYTQQPEFEAYWMQNTLIPLSIAFLDSTKKVINIEDMQANTTTLHYAKARFLYAVEANLGWFASHGVTAGAVASFTLPAGITPTH
ncbi:MAG: DUF192 domain-containing protein [Gemmatimonadetes bacterium]|nr:DUF192 domain-containing protein [Gemmatimonadota bacterium]